jgi:ribulose-phosphate 3-epimerase
MVKIAPSIILADFCHLAEELRKLEEAGADFVHWDVMDGNFVPNLTFGAHIINASRAESSLPFDVHLMVNDPELIISQLRLREKDLVVLHVEAVRDPRADLLTIKEQGWRSGLAISPDTPIERILEDSWLPVLDMVVVMGVRPGFPGQTFIESILEKVKDLRAELKARGKKMLLEVDGGINMKNAPLLVKRGADILVAGNSVFNSGLPWKEAIAKLRGAG